MEICSVKNRTLLTHPLIRATAAFIQNIQVFRIPVFSGPHAAQNQRRKICPWPLDKKACFCVTGAYISQPSAMYLMYPFTQNNANNRFLNVFINMKVWQ